MISINLKHH